MVREELLGFCSCPDIAEGKTNNLPDIARLDYKGLLVPSGESGLFVQVCPNPRKKWLASPCKTEIRPGFHQIGTLNRPDIIFIRRITMKYVSVIALLSLLALSSCANNAQTGALGGAAGGALIGQAIGHNTGATLIGAAVGGGIGYMIGNEMDKNDRSRLNNVYETGPSNQRSAWSNPDNGRQYTVTPQPAYQDRSTNRTCRRAEVEAVIDGKRERTFSTACRNEYGEWELQKS